MIPSRSFVNLAAGVILAAVHFVASKQGCLETRSLGETGFLGATFHQRPTTVWSATGIAHAAFLVLGHRVWPDIFLGAFLVNLTTVGSAASSLGIARLSW